MRILLALAAIALVAMPAAAFDPVIEHGSDVWRTPANGTSMVRFAADPLPADFFCTGSAPFSGEIGLRGVPIETSPEGALGKTDTIVQRLDNAVFDAEGVATTRLQVSAIQLQSIQPFRTACGAYHVRVTLADGPQPIGEMKIVRQGPGFGYYTTRVALNVKISFVPLQGRAPALEIVRNIEFPANRNFWASSPGEGGVSFNGFVRIDTDADGLVDTFVPGTSRNFAPGWFGGDRQDLLERAASDRGTFTEFAHGLRELPSTGPLRVSIEQPVQAVHHALQSISEGLLACDDGKVVSGNCHCEEEGTHCLEP